MTEEQYKIRIKQLEDALEPFAHFAEQKDTKPDWFLDDMEFKKDDDDEYWSVYPTPLRAVHFRNAFKVLMGKP